MSLPTNVTCLGDQSFQSISAGVSSSTDTGIQVPSFSRVPVLGRLKRSKSSLNLRNLSQPSKEELLSDTPQNTAAGTSYVSGQVPSKMFVIDTATFHRLIPPLRRPEKNRDSFSLRIEVLKRNYKATISSCDGRVSGSSSLATQARNAAITAGIAAAQAACQRLEELSVNDLSPSSTSSGLVGVSTVSV